MDRYRAEAIVNACHEAWSLRDLDRMLRNYSPNFVYTCNTEGDGKEPTRFSGLDAYRGFLEPLLDLIESVSVVEGFQYHDNTARVSVGCYYKHYRTGLVMSGQFRQVFTFEGDLIVRIEEFHDAAKMATFWRLIGETEAALAPAGRNG